MSRIVNAIIPSGATALSPGYDLQDAKLMAIGMPGTWVAADLSFQGSFDGLTYSDVYNDSNVEYLIPVGASRLLVLNVPLPFPFIKVRSGTTALAVDQTASRTISLICA